MVAAFGGTLDEKGVADREDGGETAGVVVLPGDIAAPMFGYLVEKREDGLSGITVPKRSTASLDCGGRAPMRR